MSDDAAQAFFIAGTVPFIVAGGGHALLAVFDTRRPTFFAPIDKQVVPVMENTGLRFRAMFPGSDREKPSIWWFWLGFNISHGVGAATFGLLMLVLALHDFGLVTEIGLVRPLSVAFSATYFLLALRFWFYVPAIATGIGTACFILAALA